MRKMAAPTTPPSRLARTTYGSPAAANPSGSHKTVFFGQVVAASSGLTAPAIAASDLSAEWISPVEGRISDMLLPAHMAFAMPPGACPAAGVAALRC
jgi:hypothetical protein